METGHLTDARHNASSRGSKEKERSKASCEFTGVQGSGKGSGCKEQAGSPLPRGSEK